MCLATFRTEHGHWCIQGHFTTHQLAREISHLGISKYQMSGHKRDFSTSFELKWVNWTSHGLDSNPHLRNTHGTSSNTCLKAQGRTGRKTRALFPIFKMGKSALPRWKADFCTNFKKGPTKAKCLYFHIFLLYSSRKEFILLTASLLNLLDKALLL